MTTTLPPITEMQRAWQQRDAAYDGLFTIGVRTTGIFCRPVCPARKPNPENVEYFPTPAAALFSGYRPCKRCRPLDADDQPEWAAALIADIEGNPAQRIREQDLRDRGIDPATARRHFLKRYGMTFQAYARSRRLTEAFTNLRNGDTLDGTAFESGYESLSGFREAFGKAFDGPPGKLRSGSRVVLTWLASPLGPLVAGATDDGICLLEFTDRRMIEAQFRTLRRHFQCPVVPGRHDHLDQLKSELAGYFAGTVQDFQVPLVYPGSPFQRQVWDALLKIPYGQTRSYQALAASIKNPDAVRAVGTANGFNRIAIVIPCHRVVNKNGDLGGYGGGLRRKQYLLNLEREHRAEN